MSKRSAAVILSFGVVLLAGACPGSESSDPACTFGLAVTGESVVASGGSSSVAVEAGAGCGWTAVSDAGWLAITSGDSGMGDGLVQFAFEANPAGSARVGHLTVAGGLFTVTQDGVPCTFEIDPVSALVPTGGWSGSVDVTAPPGCDWSGVSGAAWITVTAGATGSGSGAVGYSVEATGEQGRRTGSLTVAGQPFAVEQLGLGVECTSNDDCVPQAYCAASVGACGGYGYCAARPVVCPDSVVPVCGCDGVTYQNECLANMAAQRVQHSGICTG